jgi:hypothetical protein
MARSVARVSACPSVRKLQRTNPRGREPQIGESQGREGERVDNCHGGDATFNCYAALLEHSAVLVRLWTPTICVVLYQYPDHLLTMPIPVLFWNNSGIGIAMLKIEN